MPSNAPGHRTRSLVVHQADDAVVAFRIVKGVNRGDPATLDLLRSNYELGAQRGHITVWGRPLQLLACVVDILSVGD